MQGLGYTLCKGEKILELSASKVFKWVFSSKYIKELVKRPPATSLWVSKRKRERFGTGLYSERPPKKYKLRTSELARTSDSIDCPPTSGLELQCHQSRRWSQNSGSPDERHRPCNFNTWPLLKAPAVRSEGFS